MLQLSTLILIFFVDLNSIILVDSGNDTKVANLTKIKVTKKSAAIKYNEDYQKFMNLDFVKSHFEKDDATYAVRKANINIKNRTLHTVQLELDEIKAEYKKMKSKKHPSIKHAVYNGIVNKLAREVIILSGVKAVNAKFITEDAETKWRNAPPPNYKLNKNFNLESTFQNYAECAKGPTRRHVKLLDYWGEGVAYFNDKGGPHSGFAHAYNVNYQYQLVSPGSQDRNKKIPNRIPLRSYQDHSLQELYPGDSKRLTADVITIMSAPVIQETVSNMMYVLSRGLSKGHIICYGDLYSDCPQKAKEKIALHQVNGNLYRFSDFVNAPWYVDLRSKGPPYLPTIWGTRVYGMQAGDILARGSCLVSKNGYYGACFQSDGNFVVYQTRSVANFGSASTPIWSSNTCDQCGNRYTGAGYYLRFSIDGNIFIDDYGQKHIWASRTRGVPISSKGGLFMKNDGNLALYASERDETPIFCTKGCERSGFKFEGYSPCYSNKDIYGRFKNRDALGADYCRTNVFKQFEGVAPLGYKDCGNGYFKFECADTSVKGWTPCYRDEDALVLRFIRIEDLANSWCNKHGYAGSDKSSHCENNYYRFRCRAA